MNRVQRLVQAVASNAVSDEQIVDMLGELSGQELADLRTFGLLIQELAREGLDEMTLPEQHKAKPSWQKRRDTLGLRLIESEAPPQPAPQQDNAVVSGFFLDTDDAFDLFAALGINEVEAPDGHTFELVPGPEAEYLTGRDPGDECNSECCKW